MKICSWNVENLFIFMDKYDNEDLSKISNEDWNKLALSSSVENKHIQKVFDLSQAIKEINADVFVLQEVGGKESLNNLNKHFLNDEYTCLLKNGNSSRGIEIGFLIKKSLKYKYEIISNKNIKLENGKKFSRNIAELRLLDDNNEIKLIVIGVHLKSKQHGKNDFEGITQRSYELTAIENHIKYLKELNVPIIISGDFNSSRNDVELNEFASNFYEFHELKNSPEKDSSTFVSFYKQRVLSQIDFIFCTQNIFNLDESMTYRFKNEYGDVMGIPDTFDEKKYLPSDHYPLITVLNI